MLVPVADRRDIDVTLSRILPGFDLTGVELRSSPRRARWLRPYDFWTLRYGADDRVVITEHGWLTHVRNLVPHAKTQSVRLSQGPLQRRFGLADVHLDITRGPGHADRAPAECRRRARADHVPARPGPAGSGSGPRAAAGRSRRSGGRAPRPAGRPRPVRSVRAGPDRGGGESEVYALGSDRVLRIYRATHEAPAAMIASSARSMRPGAGDAVVCRSRRSWTAGRSVIAGSASTDGCRARACRLAGDGGRRTSGVGAAELSGSRRRGSSSSHPQSAGQARLLGDDAPREFSSSVRAAHRPAARGSCRTASSAWSTTYRASLGCGTSCRSG